MAHQPPIATRRAEQADRQAFATAVLLSEIDRPHDDTYCRLLGRCALREALSASAERIDEDGRRMAGRSGR